MRGKRIFWMLVFIGFSAFSQIKGVVVDENGKPIPYVNIWVENASQGTTGEENGTFQMNLQNDNLTLVFSSVGYKTKKVKVSEAKKVVLSMLVFELDEVKVSSPKGIKQIEIGNREKHFYLPEPQTSPWIIAKNIHLDSKNPDAKYLKSLIFFTKSEVEGAIFRARIFNITKDGMPGDDMVSEPIIIKTKKGKQKCTVDLSAYGLEIPNEGVIVGFESLLTEGNRYAEKVWNKASKKTITTPNYGPHIMYQHISDEESYTYGGGRWIKQTFSMYQDEKMVIYPAINAVLTN